MKMIYLAKRQTWGLQTKSKHSIKTIKTICTNIVH